jgi:hypothetical protein
MSARNRHRKPPGAARAGKEGNAARIGIALIVGGLFGVGGASYFSNSGSSHAAAPAAKILSLPRQAVSLPDGVVVTAELAMAAPDEETYAELHQRDAEFRNEFTTALMRTNPDSPVQQQLASLREHMAKVAGPSAHLRGVYVMGYLVER